MQRELFSLHIRRHTCRSVHLFTAASPESASFEIWHAPVCSCANECAGRQQRCGAVARPHSRCARSRVCHVPCCGATATSRRHSARCGSFARACRCAAALRTLSPCTRMSHALFGVAATGLDVRRAEQACLCAVRHTPARLTLTTVPASPLLSFCSTGNVCRSHASHRGMHPLCTLRSRCRLSRQRRAGNLVRGCSAGRHAL